MIDKTNIPDADQYWPATEKMLDRHFRKRRAIAWLLSLMIPALIVGLSLMFNAYRKDHGTNDLSSAKQNDLAAVSKANSLSINSENNKNESANTLTASVNNEPINITNGSNNQTNNLNKSDLNVTNKPGQLNILPADNTNTDHAFNREKKSIAAVGVQSDIGFSSADNTDESMVPGVQIASAQKMNELNTSEISYLVPVKSGVSANANQFAVEEKQWPKTVKSAGCFSHIGFEATIYGSAQYLQKSLSTTNENDWNNYLMHRKNEEEPVVMPSIGVALSANLNSISLSIGAEYTSYGERTNYYPYSNQQTIVDQSNWQTYTLHLVDTDTAYVTGNQLYLQTMYTRQDSAMVHSQDTIEEYKYDKHMAESNGVNHIYYIEFPIEISYCFTRGRAGFGVSGGISPGLLVQENGNYIRKDGRGIESFDEIDSFKKFMVNARLSADFYYRLGARTKMVLRPQFRTNLNSVFEDDYGVNQRYYSTGVLFGVSYMLN